MKEAIIESVVGLIVGIFIVIGFMTLYLIACQYMTISQHEVLEGPFLNSSAGDKK